MKPEITDEQIDQFMRTAMGDSALNAAEIEEIAGSPTIWWSVQREVARGGKVEVAPWPPPFKWVRLLGISAAAIAAIAIAVTVITMRPATESVGVASIAAVENPATASMPFHETEPNIPSTIATAAAALPIKRHVSKLPSATTRIETTTVAKATDSLPIKSGAEIKTDFIALAYARTPDSGQIVRVRVPSSMKVSLGVASNVANPSDMVDAEILVGDDGLTRAIRFIR